MTDALSIRTFSLPLAEPLSTAAGRITSRDGVAIRWRTADSVGVGEATPLPGWTEGLEECRSQLSRVSRRPIANGSAVAEIPTGYPAARHGLHLAATDADARSAGRPLASHLSQGSSSDAVPVAALVGATELSETVAAATRAARDGHSAIKCKVGAGPVDADIERLQAVRAAVGDDLELRADANRAWSLAAAENALAGLASANVSFVEEPLATPTPERLARLGACGVGIALDETVCRADSTLEHWVDVVDAVVLKPMALGGLDRAMELAERARADDLDVVVSNTVDGVIARTAAAHLAAALPTDLPAGLDTGTRLAADLAPDPLVGCDGYLNLPDAPGLGTLGPWEGAHTGGNDDSR